MPKIETLNVNVGYKNKIDLINSNSDLFKGTGKMPYPYKIILKNDYVPFVSSCRRVPETVKGPLKETLDDLLKRDIIMKVEEPTEWVNNIVLVEKPNKKIRICLDPLHLNKFVCNDQHNIPTIDELGLKLKNKSIYTVLDLKEGFYHVPLENDSMKICTFSTPFGKYCFKRLPFGLNISPEVFQRMNEKIFGDLGIGIYFDDLIISAHTEEEHDRILKRVIERAKKFGVKFNKDKIQFKVSEVKYVGQIFSESGVRPDPQYIKVSLNKIYHKIKRNC